MLGVHPLMGHNGGPSLNVADVFSTDLYTGNGGTQTITNGLDLSNSGGLVWIKSRSTSGNHYLFDTVREGNALSANLSGAQSSGWSSFFGVFNAGFGVGNQSNINGMSSAYAAWSFRRAAKFFDAVTYTGTGSGRILSHSLAAVPGMMFIKRTDEPGDWLVFHRRMGAGGSFYLQTAEVPTATVAFNNFTPTSSSFGVAGTLSIPGASYVAYLFAHDAASDGIIQCDLYVGNGSTMGPAMNLGWRPQYLLVKRTDLGGHWFIFDNARNDFGGGADATLAANQADPEGAIFSLQNCVDTTSTGFALKTDNGNLNASGGSYIYMAIRAEGT